MVTAVTAWEAPGCPFQIEFEPQKLDEIRLAVIDAFYSVPRGGIEIGGLLFGTRDGQRLRIGDYRLIACEHKTGPSFHLSENDRSGLASSIVEGSGELLGWFHSHNRSGIFLSDADLEIYDKFFPEAWQVALVIRPANMQPTRAGYFFRDSAGKVVSEASCREFVIEPLFRDEVKKRRPHPAQASIPSKPPLKETAKLAPAPGVERPLFQPLAGRKPVAPAEGQGLPWVWIAAAVALLSLCGAAFVTQSAWRAPAVPPPLHLQASEVDGKLLLHWNGVKDTPGKLTIREDGKETSIPLDTAQMSRGLYVSARHSEKIVIRLQAGLAEDVTSFAAPLLARQRTPEELEGDRREKKLKDDLETQKMRNRRLERTLKQLTDRTKETGH